VSAPKFAAANETGLKTGLPLSESSQRNWLLARLPGRSLTIRRWKFVAFRHSVNLANRKVCPRASLDIIFIAGARNDPSSPEERRRVSRCLTKWHREEISGPSSAPPRVSNYENLSRGCCTWGSRLTCSRPIHFHFGTRVVTFVAFLQPLSTSIRRRQAEALGLDKGGEK
jgi:hypothetical protein